ncbi:MAG TPA: filamentous hemagglutinin N-terminal domain-containing protein, partial [Opitutaceae bacterium]|nr:filamentous hemagglutinin N-terminal domain-containing protein [Opitutaceae bacterium]
MTKRPSFPLARRRIYRSGRKALRAGGFGLALLLAAARPAGASEITRSGISAARTAAIASGSTNAATTLASPGVTTAQTVLQRSQAAVDAVRAMQQQANQFAASSTGPNNLLDPKNHGLDVPDGLAAPDPNSTGPGLRIDVDANGNPVLWQGANLPVASGNQVTIAQNQQQALLQWRTFDIGKNTTLTYNQSAGGTNVGTWIAFNKINDPSGRPSQILGTINTIGPAGTPGSGGQIYVINRNGIIFGGSSQVNTHALVASSLPINDNLVSSGLLNNPDSQFLFSAVKVDAGLVDSTPVFDPSTIAADQAPAAGYGNVEVQPGASLTAPSSADHVGGLIALIGPNVHNGGTINTPDGQTILAAGLQVGLAAHNTSDPSLRGLDVYVGKVSDPTLPSQPPAGTAENDDVINGAAAMGDIEAPHADVTLTGQTVNQFGLINSSTTVALNGRIDLLANYGATTNAILANSSPSNQPPFLFQSTGSVNLGPGSWTQILPDLSDPGRVAGTSLALPSLVNIQGRTIHLAADAAGDPSSGAVIYAPGAAVPAANPALSEGAFTSLNAGVTLSTGSWDFLSLGTSSAQSLFLNSTPPNGAGQFDIYFDPGATIDVSGSQNVGVPVSENVVPVQLLGAQLADSPLQRNGALRGKTIDVDIRQSGNYNGQEWAGTPLADTTGYINLIQRSVGELTTNGGTVALNAGGAVVMQDQSVINVSGGWINYLPGLIQTTQLMVGGHLVDISKATPDMVYQGIYTGTSSVTDPKWGVTETFASPLSMNGAHYDPGYIQGGSAGSIFITAPSMALDGDSSGKGGL